MTGKKTYQARFFFAFHYFRSKKAGGA